MDRSAQRTITPTRNARKRTPKRSRAIAAISVTAGLVLSTVTGTTAAQAADPAFEIFFGKDCSGGGSASRVYTGENLGEGWVNDTFNKTQWGSWGVNQRVRNNAESIYLSNAHVRIYINGDRSLAWEEQSRGQCYNLPDGVSNHNTQWATYNYSLPV
ncbi:hypothetical protein [Clavibacter sp. VKM Ac-2872]|uniref:hypothetical protein n=1 Tax=Clavibacter sp. VKM Ac-2872 TaxID=2783812 RepID=UPI00188C11EF|nr:hypothetical protein [Clavibacter sp. VKM Ac-2872]MBF4623411.1 hypothetical protein [Clavibacter sp. VKM Ac-2872]